MFRYDFTVHEIKKQRKYDEILGTLHHGNEILVNNVTVKCHDKIFAIESVIPLAMRTKEYDQIMIKETPRSKQYQFYLFDIEIRLITINIFSGNRPLNCTTCRDKTEVNCRDCGCNVCAKKDDPDKVIFFTYPVLKYVIIRKTKINKKIAN